MTQNYKLSNEIKEFIIEQKKNNGKLSCRSMVDIIKDRFHIEISKSLINRVIKEQNLSAPVGRRRINEIVTPVKEIEVPATAPEIQVVKPEKPVKEPAIPIKEPEMPVIKPEIPIIKPEISVIKPEIPIKVPEIPIKEAEIPEIKPIIPPKPALKIPEANFIWQGADFMENGGFFFLKTADFKLDLTFSLAELLSAYFPGLSRESHQAIIETLIYSPYFKNKRDLCLLIGAEVSEEAIKQYSEQLVMVPFLQLKDVATKVGIVYNSSEINWLWKEVLLRLSSYIVHFFPPEYQFLDFQAMLKRFYFLPGKLIKRTGMVTVQLICPKGFFGLNDIIWQEGFSHAAARVNEAKILTSKKEQIWINPQVQYP